MKKIYFLLSLLLTAVSSTFATPKTPQVVIPDNYQGTSFTAQWNANGSSQYLFSLYTLGTDMVSVTEDFSKVNQSNGKLDTTNPNLPADWTVDLAENGTTEVVYYNDKNHLLLDATGDKIVTPLLVGGNLSKYVLNANLVHAEGVTEDNSSVFNIKVYDKEGDLLTQGDIYAIYFARRQDFVLSEAFGYTPLNIGKIEITIKKDDTHNVGDISVNSISYEYKAPVYVLTDQPTTEDHYDATGLDAEAVYYYYVKAKEGNEVSPMSGIMRVDGFLSVKVLPASNVGVDAFTANWEYLPKAKGYYLQPYRYDVAAEAGVFSALNEKFSKSLDGTIESPITSVTTPDDLTDCPGWTGQDAVNTAKAFNDRINFDGVVLTKLDGDTRGGAALSIRAVVDKPIKFVSTGEGVDKNTLDPFRPAGMADRILGMGDIVSFVDRMQQQYDENEAKKLEAKLRKNTFNFNDFKNQIASIKKMGNLKDLASMIPGVGKALKDVDIKDDAFKSIEAIIDSMTPYEREHPEVLLTGRDSGHRRKRLALGSGTKIEEVNRLLKQFDATRKMMHSVATKNPMQMLKGMRRK